jgi:hypothetical protein
MGNMNKSHKHHYVPEWYQRRFMLNRQTAYYRLDLYPELIVTPDGITIKKGELYCKGPSKFFYEIDLYTTEYFEQKNDDIERYLFGKIDKIGSLALKAMASNNWNELHLYFSNFYEYMSVQKLRTPKGLNWMLSTLRPKNYNELLHVMQRIRHMNCVMWCEAVMEVVSAEDSDVKFIVSDTPVTSYNPVCYPESKYCKFPNDPPIELQGTRTIFPLDLNHCVILTNLEYARCPGRFKALKSRTNPRFFDQTFARYDNIIRGRKLDRQSVLGINYILKNRAMRFIAAAKEEWLYPEQYLYKDGWGILDKILISKEFQFLGRGGETFFAGKNGELIAMQDDFGRKSRNLKEWEEKEKRLKELQNTAQRLIKKSKQE